ncbi:MAG: class I SAM-dependent methyltransferase [Anaerolineales bacterium]|nr:class I SAM-dependent methyltransferase [Anaerolineales bacterium]
MTNLLEHNREAWNEEVKNGNIWSIPATKEEIEKAKKGQYKIVLTPKKPVPEEWMGDIKGKKVLCLASGGGQQGPILAAVGATITVFDNSDQQLKRDQEAVEEYNLDITTVQGNMQDLSCFTENTFDLIIHPVSNCFIDDIRPVWKESYRVLKLNGALLSGFCNPIIYMIDWDTAEDTKRIELVHAIPYSDLQSLTPEMKQKYIQKKTPFEFGHSLTDQIQGQIDAGFVISGFYEDKGNDMLDKYTDMFVATKALKMG